MSGMTRGFAMSKETEFCRAIEGKFPSLARWVSLGLGETDLSWMGENYYTSAFICGSELVGGVVYHDIRPGRDVWLTIYTTDKKWCNRKNLKHIFQLAFEYFKCQRVSVGVSEDNLKSLKLVRGLGFHSEGCLRNYDDNGNDYIVFGMLKQECKWRNKHE